MTRLLERAGVDHAAIAAAVEGLRDRGATCQAYLRADGMDVCINAVNAGGDGWPGYSAAASRRAAAGGRRMLPVLDSGDIDGRLWIAYDLGSATSLSDQRGRHLLPTATSLRVLSDVARALDDAAAEGVFASELPPASVFVAGKGARLGDLGTAREGLAGAEFELEGDPAYVPPEVLRGGRAGTRSGVYLFGALLHYLLTGGPPQNGSATTANGRLDLPASIKAVVARAMLVIRTPGSHLRARVLNRPPKPPPQARPVRLGALQAWRHAEGRAVRYAIPTTEGTLKVSCRMTDAGSSRQLRRCERTASTIELRHTNALPLAKAVEDSRRLGAALAALSAERDAARARLSSAATPEDQQLVAQDLAESHQRAAAVLHEIEGAEAVEAGARRAADAYSRLAAAAASGSAEGWTDASERVRRSDAVLAEAVAAAR